MLLYINAFAILSRKRARNSVFSVRVIIQIGENDSFCCFKIPIEFGVFESIHDDRGSMHVQIT